MCWSDSRGIQKQEAIEVGDYRSRGMEKAVLERELSGEAEGCSQRRVSGGREEEGMKEERMGCTSEIEPNNRTLCRSENKTTTPVDRRSPGTLLGILLGPGQLQASPGQAVPV